MKTRMLLRVAIVIAALSTAGAASTAALVLPGKANSHAKDATASVTTGASVTPTENPEPSGSPAAAAAYGQCVSANAQTAADNVGQGSSWNPTDGCANANAGAANAQNGANTGSQASTNANSHASAGLTKAADAGANGSDNAAAQGGNAP